MSCKSAIYAVNTSTATIPEGGTYQPNTIIRRFGQCCQMANNAMELNGQGYYDVAVTATVIGTAVGIKPTFEGCEGKAFQGATNRWCCLCGCADRCRCESCLGIYY